MESFWRFAVCGLRLLFSGVESGIRKILLFRPQYLQGLVVDGVDGVAFDGRLLLALARLVWQEVALHIPVQKYKEQDRSFPR